MLVICLHTHIWYQAFLANINNLQADLFGIIGGILIGTTILDLSGPWNNGQKEAVNTCQSSRTKAFSMDVVQYHTQDTCI